MSYMTLSSQEKHHFYSFRTFAHIRQHYFSKYWGDECMGRPPPQTFGGTVPPVPLGFRLWCLSSRRMLTYFHSYRRARELIIGKGFRDISHALRKPGQRRSRYSLKL